MKNMSLQNLIVLLGPTSSGKSALAIEMAKRWNGEIISADSRQVYRGMDIGTGKVKRDGNELRMTNDELRINKTTKSQDFSIRNCSLNIENWYSSEGVPHHLLDIADPNDDYNVSHFLRDARIAIEDIANRGKLTILCGGTGFWIQALVENQELPDIPPNPTLRETLSQKTPGELFEMLRKLDSARAKQIDRNNPHRLIRAIEIARDKNYELSITNYQLLVSSRIVSSSLKIDHCTLIIALCPPKDVLDAKIRARLDARFAEGMIEEVTKLHDKGVSWERLDAFGLEYRWISRYLRRMIGEKEMKEKLFFESIHYAKRQMTWIRRWHRSNPALHIIETPEEAMDLAGTFLETEK